MHIPVLLSETIELLNIKPGGTYLDLTGGGGGHSEKILSFLEAQGKLIVGDRDPQAVAGLKEKFKGDGRVTVIQARFSEEEKFRPYGPFDGAVADLGFSSLQLSDPSRGLSFLTEAPLDMRQDPGIEDSAADLVNNLPEGELADLFYQLGEEKGSRKIARAIAYDRNEKLFATTTDLAGLCERVLGPGYRRHRQKIHPATRVFQSLRIRVNDELGQLKALLKWAPLELAPNGRLAVISFHSLEDRMVKEDFRNRHRLGYLVVTKKPIVPSDEEASLNPRSRSAKLRGLERD